MDIQMTTPLEWTTYDFDNMPFNDTHQCFCRWWTGWFHTFSHNQCWWWQQHRIWRCLKVPSRARYSLISHGNQHSMSNHSNYLSKTSLHCVLPTLSILFWLTVYERTVQFVCISRQHVKIMHMSVYSVFFLLNMNCLKTGHEGAWYLQIIQNSLGCHHGVVDWHQVFDLNDIRYS